MRGLGGVLHMQRGSATPAQVLTGASHKLRHCLSGQNILTIQKIEGPEEASTLLGSLLFYLEWQ